MNEGTRKENFINVLVLFCLSFFLLFSTVLIENFFGFLHFGLFDFLC